MRFLYWPFSTAARQLALERGKESGAASPRPLDVGNVMWLLAAMAFVVGPHLTRLPNWLGIFFLAVVAWRAWIAGRRCARRRPR